MARVVAALGFFVVSATAMLCGACGQSALSTPRPPPLDVETRIVPPRRQPELPRLIAPPPAYGNKVVLSHADSATGIN